MIQLEQANDRQQLETNFSNKMDPQRPFLTRTTQIYSTGSDHSSDESNRQRTAAQPLFEEIDPFGKIRMMTIPPPIDDFRIPQWIPHKHVSFPHPFPNRETLIGEPIVAIRAMQICKLVKRGEKQDAVIL